MQPVSVLAISGSVRPVSSNTALLKAMAQMAPEHVQFSYCPYLDEIPHFHPDITGDNVAETVTRLRNQIAAADAVVICTPEYAFGVPGTLKNALDWTVSSGSLNDKPVAAISASPLYTGGDKAMSSLLLTLKALGARMDAASSLCVGSVYKVFPDKEHLEDEQVARQLQQLLDHLLQQVAAARQTAS